MSYKPSDTMNLVHEVKKLGWHFTYSKENISINRHDVTLSLYREVDPEAWREEYRKKQAAGVRYEKRWYDRLWHKGKCDFTGKKEDYREVPQEIKIEVGKRYTHVKSGKVYEVMSFAVNEADGAQMVMYRNVTTEDQWVRLESEFKEKFVKYMAVPLPQQQPHAAERALWKAQREAGTNEVWQCLEDIGMGETYDIPANDEPLWSPDIEYRVKPTKLTARICMVGKAYPMSYIGQDWEFTGTREEYRAECEKYGYVVISEIKEVVEKPKTVTYYFALYKTPHGYITSISGHTKDWVNEWITDNGHTIIGDIEEREV